MSRFKQLRFNGLSKTVIFYGLTSSGPCSTFKLHGEKILNCKIGCVTHKLKSAIESKWTSNYNIIIQKNISYELLRYFIEVKFETETKSEFLT